jgi:hypothetical protein
MRDVNLALITKLGWKLHTKTESLWTAQLQGKYLKNCSFLSPTSSSSSSWLWKGILKSKPFISKGACNRIHSSSFLPTWSSSWIPTIPAFFHSPSPLLSLPLPNLIVSNLFCYDPHSFSIFFFFFWNSPLLHTLFDSANVREILKTSSSSLSLDEHIWTPSTNDSFSTKSTYKLISSQRTSALSPLFPSQWKLL